MFSKPRFILIQLTLILAFSLSACGPLFGTPNTPTPNVPTSTPKPPTPTPPPSAAVVNGEYITLEELNAELARYQAAQSALGKTVSDEDARQAVLDDLIAQTLLAQAARAGGFTLTEADLQSRLDGLVAQSGGADAFNKWMSDHGYTDPSFRIALKRSAEAAWMRDNIIADVPKSAEQVHLQQILTYNEADALQTLENLRSGADFSEQAALYDPVTRGELGWVPRGYLLDRNVEDAAFSLSAGAYSDVIATPAGFHIFKVLERGDHPLSPDALLTLQGQALAEWLRQQREQGAVTIL